MVAEHGVLLVERDIVGCARGVERTHEYRCRRVAHIDNDETGFQRCDVGDAIPDLDIGGGKPLQSNDFHGR
jgi:hypothetical protein